MIKTVRIERVFRDCSWNFLENESKLLYVRELLYSVSSSEGFWIEDLFPRNETYHLHVEQIEKIFIFRSSRELGVDENWFIRSF